MAAEVPVTLSYTRVAQESAGSDAPSSKYCNASAHFVPKRGAQYEVTTMADPSANRCGISVVQIAPAYMPVALGRAVRCEQMDGGAEGVPSKP